MRDLQNRCEKVVETNRNTFIAEELCLLGRRIGDSIR